jgi:hypothetical protein
MEISRAKGECGRTHFLSVSLSLLSFLSHPLSPCVSPSLGLPLCVSVFPPSLCVCVCVCVMFGSLMRMVSLVSASDSTALGAEEASLHVTLNTYNQFTCHPQHIQSITNEMDFHASQWM